jgi:hypothetical protein
MSTFDPGALLSRSYALAHGPRVRLRLPARRDERAIAALLERAGAGDHRLEAARLVRSDPRRRLVICAVALVDASETLLGVGEIELDGDGAGAPVVTCVDDLMTEGLKQLLTDALSGRAAALARTRAA